MLNRRAFAFTGAVFAALAASVAMAAPMTETLTIDDGVTREPAGLYVDVTQPPYCADKTGRTDCTKALVQALDDILVRTVEAYEATVEKMQALSDKGRRDVYLGLETARMQDGKLIVVYPEYEPPTRIVYFPKGTYLIGDTLTYSLKNLKARHYVVPYFDICRNIHFLGEDRDATVIRLADNAPGFASGRMKSLVSFVNNEKVVPRDKEVTNIGFMNSMRNLTLDCGRGNPDAVGIRYVASNIGRLENLTIRTDAGRSGVYTMCTTQCLLKDLEIIGFDYGLDICHSAMITIEGLDVTRVRKAGLFTGGAAVNAGGIKAGSVPVAAFAPGHGRYYFRDRNLTLPAERFDNRVYCEAATPAWCDRNFPPPPEVGGSIVCVDDFGARGDGVTDSAPAVQRALNSGKAEVAFGSGEYLLNAKVYVPKSVRKIDFRFCSLAAGIRLVGGEYDAAFEIAEDADGALTVENLDAWERFRGHMRLFKHAAKRDAVFRDIHLMTASLYFNSVPGSRVWFDNIFLTTGTYTPGGVDIPGRGFVQVYNRILPFEFHGQKVYGRQVNLERADVHVLNDGSDVLFDCFRTEGPGTAVKSVNGGRTQVNLFNAGIGSKTAPQALFNLKQSSFALTGALVFGFSTNSEYNVIVNSMCDGVVERLVWDDVRDAPSGHARRIDSHCITPKIERKEIP